VSPRDLFSGFLFSFAVMAAIVIGLTLLFGQPVRPVTVARTVLIAAIASALLRWFNDRKALRG
jgi:hypothetical protein